MASEPERREAMKKAGPVISAVWHLIALGVAVTAVRSDNGTLYLLAVLLELIYWMTLHRRWNPPR